MRIHFPVLSFFAALLMLSVSSAARTTYNFNPGWTVDYTVTDTLAALGTKPVTLPHAWNEDDTYRVPIARMSTGRVRYAKQFSLPASADGRKVFIEFEGARQNAEVILNGRPLGRCDNGVMAFGFDITDALLPGSNTIEVLTDNSWDAREPSTDTPWQWNNINFYANYGGLPRNVRLHLCDSVYQTLPLYSNLGTTGVYIYGEDYDIPARSAVIVAESQVRNESSAPVTERLKVDITDPDGNPVARFEGAPVTIAPGATAVLTARSRVGDLHFWSWGYGYLYNVRMLGKSTSRDLFGDIRELDSRNDEKAVTGKGSSLAILEIEFLKDI